MDNYSTINKKILLCEHGTHVIPLVHNIFIATVTSYNHKPLINREMHAWHPLIIIKAISLSVIIGSGMKIARS